MFLIFIVEFTFRKGNTIEGAPETIHPEKFC